jgi:hypothetical protein
LAPLTLQNPRISSASRKPNFGLGRKSVKERWAGITESGFGLKSVMELKAIEGRGWLYWGKWTRAGIFFTESGFGLKSADHHPGKIRIHGVYPAMCNLTIIRALKAKKACKINIA